MMKSKKCLLRPLALLCCLPILLCAMLSFAAIAKAKAIDIETYDGVVILEDPVLLGDVEEDEGSSATETPTEQPATDAPTASPTASPTTEPTQTPTTEPTTSPTNPPTASYDIAMVLPSGWYASRIAMEITISDLGGYRLEQREDCPKQHHAH